MGNLMLKLFVKDYKDINNPDVRRRIGFLGAGYGLSTNIFLFVFKVIVGFIFSQMALIADALNNLSDLFSSAICIFGFKISSKPADKEHPYGHQKAEYISSLLISMLIVVLGVLTIYSSGKGIYDFFSNPNYNFFDTTFEKIELIITPIVLGLSILLKLSQMYLYYFLSKKINSLSLKATGDDSRNDVISTSLILVGFIVTAFTKISFDNYLAVFVAILVVYNGIKIAIDASNEILEKHPDEEVIQSLVNLIMDDKLVLGVHDLILHSNGANGYYGSIHVELDSRLSLIDAHDCLDNIEKRVKEKLNIDLVTHTDPIVIGDTETDETLVKIKNVVNSIDKEVTIHDFRMVKGHDFRKCIFELVAAVDMKHLSKQEKKLLNELGQSKFLDYKFEKLKEEIATKFNKMYPSKFRYDFVIEIDNKVSDLLDGIKTGDLDN